MRWQRRVGQLVAPDEFIALAEETGLIVFIALGCGRTPNSKSLPATVAALTGWRPQGRYLMQCRSLIDGI